MAFVWNVANAAHLHRRAGFGASAQLVDESVKQGFEKTLNQVLKPDKKLPKAGKKALKDLPRLQTWWVARLVKGRHPLHDRMTLFWHNHFATAQSKVQNLWMMRDHVALLHDRALGDFRKLVAGVSRDPAMLIWLDNWLNVAGDINENYARELMELFTTGVLDSNGDPNYTEQDVVEVARAFTGWTLRDEVFYFSESLHDHGMKTVKGVSGTLNGDDVIDLLVADPATARRLARKLWSHFAFPIELDDPLAVELAGVYFAEGRRINRMLEAIFRHDAFYSDEARRALVKGPAEWYASALRLLSAHPRKDHPYEVGGAVEALGQSLFNPPSVFGWGEGEAWVATAGLLERAVQAEVIADARDKYAPLKWSPEKLLGPKKLWPMLDAAAAVDAVLGALDLPDADPGTRAQLLAYAALDGEGQPQPVVVDEDFVDLKLRGLVALVLSSPEWQMA